MKLYNMFPSTLQSYISQTCLAVQQACKNTFLKFVHDIISNTNKKNTFEEVILTNNYFCDS